MTETRLHNLRLLELENEWLSLSVLPEVVEMHLYK